MKQLVQGDVKLNRVVENFTLPENAKRIEPNRGRVVLAYGETTGHAHSLASEDVALYELPDGRMLLIVERQTPLIHSHIDTPTKRADHDPIEVLPGTYWVVRQREYTPKGTLYVSD